MAETTAIQWAHATRNKVIGCDKVSEGCQFCYADEQDEKRYSKTLGGATKENPIRHWGKGAPRYVCTGFDDDIRKWNANPPKEWKLKPGERGRIFPNSFSDWLDEEWPIQVLAEFLAAIRAAENLDFLCLTKRPQNWRQRIEAAADWHFDHGDRNVTGWLQDWWKHGIAPKNIWFGVSTENQKRYNERWRIAKDIPAQVTFISAEPMLGPIRFEGILAFDWIIFGGESGRGARPCNIDWIRDGVKQCRAAGVAPFVKQLGASPMEAVVFSDTPRGETEGVDLNLKDKKGGDITEFPKDLQVREFPA